MPVVKSIPIMLDRQRRLCFDFNAFAELERECNLTILDLRKFSKLAEDAKSGKSGLVLPLHALRGFLWAGLLDETPDITLKDVGALLEEIWLDKSGEVAEALFNAIMESTFFKAAEKETEGTEKKTVTPTTVKERATSKKTTT